MAGQLITLPVRVGVRAAQLSVRLGLDLTFRAFEFASDALGRNGHADADVAVAAPPAPRVQTPPPPPPSAPPEPSHVSEEAVLVEEFAEPGAEEGAGASVTVAEPWEGYDELNAKEVIRRVRDAGAAELAAVQLYEGSNRNRETVLSAVKRELRSKNGNT